MFINFQKRRPKAMMRVCGNCKKNVDDAATVCPFCGASVRTEDASVMAFRQSVDDIFSNIPSFADIVSGKTGAGSGGTDEPNSEGGSGSDALPSTDEAVILPISLCPTDNGAECNRTGMDYTLARGGKPQDYRLATRWFAWGAALGNASAMYNLASNYSNARGIPRNYSLAATWYAKAVDLGSASAANDLGNMYQHGRGVAEDGDKAFELYNLALERGSKAAACNIGFCYDKGIGTEQNFEKAFEFYRRAAESGSAAGANNLGYMYECGHGTKADVREALRWYTVAYERGSIMAANNAGNLLHGGSPELYSAKEALLWYERAAEGGNTSAMYSAGEIYYAGEGEIPRDYNRAAEYYLRAAKAGNPDAQNDIGHMYQHGYGVEKNTKLAVEWYKTAAEGGNIAAYNNLGYCYDNAIGVEADFALAFEYYTKAAEGGSAAAKNNIAYAYENGRGVDENLALAAKYYAEAAVMGSRVSPGNLKRLKENPSRYAAINRAYAELAEAGDGEAMYALFEAYSIGRGVPRDDERAFECLRSAAAAGYTRAYADLAVALLYGIGAKASAKDARLLFEKAKSFCEFEGAKGVLPEVKAYSKYILSLMFSYGLAVGEDAEMARSLAEEAARLGCAEAHNRYAYAAVRNCRAIAELAPSDDRFYKSGRGALSGEVKCEIADGELPLGYYEGFLAVDGKYMFTPRMIQAMVVDMSDGTATLLLKQPVLFGEDANSFTVSFSRKSDKDADVMKLAAVAEASGVDVRYL